MCVFMSNLFVFFWQEDCERCCAFVGHQYFSVIYLTFFVKKIIIEINTTALNNILFSAFLSLMLGLILFVIQKQINTNLNIKM